MTAMHQDPPRRADRIPTTHLAREREHERVRRELAANGYTWETYNRGKYKEKKTRGQNNSGAEMRLAAQVDQDPEITGQAPTGTNQDITASDQDPPMPGGSKPPETGEKPKHLGHISIPYCKGISEPLARIMRKGGRSTLFTTRGSIREQLVHLKDPVE
jgi:hypothetical protein